MENSLLNMKITRRGHNNFYSSRKQLALKRNDLKNGVFTYSIFEAMNKFPSMKVSELKKIVGERVEQLTKELQKPTSRNEAIAVDWNVW